MDLNYLKKVIKLFDNSSLSDITIEEEGTKITLSKDLGQGNANQGPIIMHQPATPVTNQTQVVETSQDTIQNVESAVSDENKSSGFHNISSPIVGTFYKSPSPDSPPFVKVGDKVEAGQTLCIVEAMKLMNEIECDVAGTVEKVLLNDADPVEYGQDLFHIKPD